MAKVTVNFENPTIIVAHCSMNFTNYKNRELLVYFYKQIVTD